MRIPFLILTILVLSLQCNASVASPLVRDKETNILFYLHNIHAEKDSSSVLVAQNANAMAHARGIVAFSSVYVFDDVITKGPSITSKVLGNAQGMYVGTAKDGYTILMVIDVEITTGPFNGSSFVLFSRNPLRSTRELPVIGGRGAFRMAQGYGMLRMVSVHCLTSTNPPSGDVIEYNVTLWHH
ncbi:dirigent protein 15-like [Aegilops tauschii subsp. strangulata]|nr:dirigent protein 15-like [Aegilops tauschii subsp. strangulata]